MSGNGRPVALLADLTAASLAQLPAVLVIVAGVVVLFALLPRWATVLS